MKNMFLLVALATPAVGSDYPLPDYLGPDYFYKGKAWYGDVMLDYRPPNEPDVEIYGCGRDLSYVECLHLKILYDRPHNKKGE